MTEQEWDTCDDSRDMLDALTSLSYPAAVIRRAAVRILATFSSPSSATHAMGADYAHSLEERESYLELAGDAWEAENALRNPDCSDPAKQFRPATSAYAMTVHGCAAIYADTVREQVGNPYRPVSVDPSWLTTDVLALARGIRAEGAYDRMPVLADAVQEAGCGDEAVLRHCRQDKPHHEGCWVIRLLLGEN